MIKVILESIDGTQKEIELPTESVAEAGIIECESRFYVYMHQTKIDVTPKFVEAKLLIVTNT